MSQSSCATSVFCLVLCTVAICFPFFSSIRAQTLLPNISSTSQYHRSTVSSSHHYNTSETDESSRDTSETSDASSKINTEFSTSKFTKKSMVIVTGILILAIITGLISLALTNWGADLDPMSAMSSASSVRMASSVLPQSKNVARAKSSSLFPIANKQAHKQTEQTGKFTNSKLAEVLKV